MDVKDTFQPGKFIKWAEPVAVDLRKKILSILPIARPEEIVEIPLEERPEDETLDLRCKSY